MTIRSALRGALLGLTVLSFTFHVSEASAQKSKAKAKAAAPAASKKAPASSKQKKQPAPPKKTSLAIGPFSGNKPKEIRTWVSDALEDDFVLTDAEDFKPKNTDAGFSKMASDLGVEAVLVGKVEKQRIVLTIRGADGAVVKDIVIKGARGPRLKKALEAGVPQAVASAVGAKLETEEAEEEAPAEAAEEPEEAEAAKETTDESEETTDEGEEDSSGEEEEASTPSRPSGSPLVLMGGVRFFNRTLTFNDTLPQVADPAFAMRNYELRLGPAAFIKLQLYPGAFLGGDGFASNIGLIGGFEQGMPIASKYAGNLPNVPPELTNSTQEWFVGSRLRFPGETTEFGGAITYGQQKFILEGDELFPIVPDVKYGYLRLGGDAWFNFGALFVGVELGVRLVLGTGELERKDLWFENAAGNGIDLGLRFGYQLFDSVAIVLGGDLIRYGFDFNPMDKATATRVAGGAIDQYLSGFAGVRFTLPGSGSATAASSASAVSASAEASVDEDESDDAEEASEEESEDEL